MKSKSQREYDRQQERAKKYNCDGICYCETRMCPRVETCDETRVFEFIANVIGSICVLVMLALVPIAFIVGCVALIWAIFAV